MLESQAGTVGAGYAYARKHLDDTDARYLTAAAFDMEFTELVGSHDEVPSISQVNRLRSFVTRRIAGEPIAYILGRQGFWQHDFLVSPATLIPRPETETLVETVLPYLSRDSLVLDLGTGSGVIGLSIAAECGAKVLLTDVSKSALDVARANAKRLQLDVRFLRSDWYAAVDKCFDCIVSNPPYVASDDPHLRTGDLVFEPEIALDAGDDGINALNIVIRRAPSFLRTNGLLAVEHGYDQAEQVQSLFALAGFERVQLTRDLSGQPRVTHGFLA